METNLFRWISMAFGLTAIFAYLLFVLVTLSSISETVERMENRQLFIGQSSYWHPEDCEYHDFDD